jgi:Domain of unknown function (DUF4389)
VDERIRVTFDMDLRRRRLAALARVAALVELAFVLAIWTLLALGVLLAVWPVALAKGRIPEPLHRFQLRYLSGWTRGVAWFALVSAPRTVTVDARRSRQSRVTVLLRPLLALPAIVLASVLTVALGGTAIAAWFVAVARGRTTEGLRELGAFCIRYQAETLAYLLLLTPRYPALAPQTPQ